MVRTCGSATDVAYDGANVSATNNGLWHFLHGPGTDDPLLGVGQALNGATKEFYWVTDGQGRQYALAEATGWWDPDFNANTWPGFQQAGGITDATGYKAGRGQGSAVPGVSYFRNRIYDQASGQWTQEDPLGLAGGINLYQYAGGNPAMFTDPWGLCPEWKDKIPCVKPVDGDLTPAGVDPKGKSARSGAEGSEYGKTRFLSGASASRDKDHWGFDDAGAMLSPVSAAGGGTVSYGHTEEGGNNAALRLDSGYTVVYNHLDPLTNSAQVSGRVEAGDVLGYLGDSGNSHGSGRDSHVHVTVLRPGGGTCNPRDFFAATGGGSCK